MPDLPPTSEIARLARSPTALLAHLSSLPSEEDEAPDGSYQPPAGAAANGTGEDATDAGAGAGDAVSEAGVGGTDGTDGTVGAVPDGGGAESTAPATNGRPAVAPQPADVAVPADPTLN
jgi:hypothetical protein